MKHIRRFNENTHHSDLFGLISMDEYLERKDKYGPDIPFTESEKKKLLNFLQKEWGDDVRNWSLTGHANLELEMGSNKSKWGETTSLQDNRNKKFVQLIQQSPDEWFYVKEWFYVWCKGQRYSSWRQFSYRTFEDSEHVYESYFKCDSFEGLFELIRNRKKRIMDLC